MEFISILFFVLCIFSGTSAKAQEEAGPRIYMISAAYSPLDFPVPNKWGLAGGFAEASRHRWEVEYLKGSLSIPGGFRDLGSIEDTRIGLIRRSYPGKTFHFSYGISYFDFSATIGDVFLNNLTGGVSPRLEAMTIQGLGFNLGIGNTWVIRENIILGIDWLSWAQPLVITRRSSDFLKYVTNQKDKNSVEDTIRVVSYFPRFAALTLRLGVVF